MSNSIDKPESSSGCKRTGNIVIRNLPPSMTQKVREGEGVGSGNCKHTNLAGNLCIARSL